MLENTPARPRRRHLRAAIVPRHGQRVVLLAVEIRRCKHVGFEGRVVGEAGAGGLGGGGGGAGDGLDLYCCCCCGEVCEVGEEEERWWEETHFVCEGV